MKRANNWERRVVNIPEQTLRDLYIGRALPIEAVADELGFCAATILKYMRRYGIPSRPRIAWGEAHHHWQGGRYLGGGYWMRYKPDHPRASRNSHYVREHILIWEEAHGKLLPASWHIHHLNGIKTDNRIVNLEALPSKKHYLITNVKARRIQQLEALLKNQGQLV